MSQLPVGSAAVPAQPAVPLSEVASGFSGALRSSAEQRASSGVLPGAPTVAAVPRGGLDVEEGLLEGTLRRGRALAAAMREPDQRWPLLSIAFFLGLLVYSYGPGLLNASSSWTNPQYSHGWIVPLFSAALLFWWWKPLQPVSFSARAAGLGLMLASFALRLFAAKFRIITIDMYTFVPAFAGVVLLFGGWSLFRWAWAPLAFLIFMFPLPDEATRYLLGPLQTVATIVSTFALQTLGLEAYREGNQIVVGEMHMGVVDACSGLRMLTIFIALSVALVLVGGHDWYENAAILASAIPIALIVNSVRITVTGVLYQFANSEVAEMVFHDLAGWFMMPMALGMLYLVQLALSHLFYEEEKGLVTLASGGSVRPSESHRFGPAPLPVDSAAQGQSVPGERR